MKRKLIALAGVLLFAACPLTACQKPHKSENAGLNMTENEMPYGSTLVILGKTAVSQSLLELCHFRIGDFVCEPHRSIINLKKWRAVGHDKIANLQLG